MSDVQLHTKPVAITQCKLGQQILDRQWWEELGSALHWKLHWFEGRQWAEFWVCEVEQDSGVWEGLNRVDALMRQSLMYALCLSDEPDRSALPDRSIRLPLAPVVVFHRPD